MDKPPKDDKTDELIGQVLAPLPEEVREELWAWVERARAGSVGDVERDLLIEAKVAREAFEDAAVVVERLISE